VSRRRLREIAPPFVVAPQDSAVGGFVAMPPRPSDSESSAVSRCSVTASLWCKHASKRAGCRSAGAVKPYTTTWTVPT